MDIPLITTGAGTGSGVNVSRAERWLSVAGGSAMALHGLKRGGAAGIAEALLGGALLQRGATGHCHTYEALKISTAGAGGDAARSEAKRFVHVRQSYTIQKDAGELYSFWRALEQLPEFMKHLKSVEVIDERRSRWAARGPLGTTIEWEAEIVEDVQDERIAWRSVEGSEIANSGSVNFKTLPHARGTEVAVSLEYAPPAGAAGDLIARLFGENPEQQVRDDLRRFKRLVEAGENPTTEGQPSGRRGVTVIGTVIP